MTASPFDNPLFARLLGDDELAPLFTAEAEIEAMLRFESALANVQAEAGLIGKDAAAAIAAGCARFEPDFDALAKGFANDGVLVPGFVKALRQTIGEPHGAAAHFGTTTQDVTDTALVLRLAEAIDILQRRLSTAIGLIEELNEDFGNIVTIGRTRMQRAVPITVGERCNAWQAPLETALIRMEDDIAGNLLMVQLAGAAGNLDKMGEDGPEIRAALAAALDLDDPGRSWHADRERFVAFSDWLSHVTGACGKIGMDLVLLAQNEVAEVRLPSGGSSSAMPHKRNPVLAEILVTLARFNATQTGAMHDALVHEFERSGMAWTLEWLVLPQMTLAAGRSLDLLCQCLDGLEIGPSRET
jgi:3-carboxy-cis,cis-muconate cycloisomerase